MRVHARTPARMRGAAWRAEPEAATAAIGAMLAWVAREQRAERTFAWHRSLLPRAFIRARPPGAN